jgi:hypothetical protein
MFIPYACTEYYNTYIKCSNLSTPTFSKYGGINFNKYYIISAPNILILLCKNYNTSSQTY